MPASRKSSANSRNPLSSASFNTAPNYENCDLEMIKNNKFGEMPPRRPRLERSTYISQNTRNEQQPIYTNNNDKNPLNPPTTSIYNTSNNAVVFSGNDVSYV